MVTNPPGDELEPDPLAVLAELMTLVRTRKTTADDLDRKASLAIKANKAAQADLGAAVNATRDLVSALTNGAGYDHRSTPTLDDALTAAHEILTTEGASA